MLIRYPKINRSEHVSRNCILYVREKNNFLNTDLLYLLTFMYLSFKIGARLIEQWKYFNLSYVENSLVNWELSFYQDSVSAIRGQTNTLSLSVADAWGIV